MWPELKKISLKYWPVFPLLILLVGVFFSWQRLTSLWLGLPPISPLAEGEVFTPSWETDLETIGFLPYWNLEDGAEVDFSTLDQLIYFGLKLGDNGEIVKITDWEVDPGWSNLENSKLAEIFEKGREKNKKILISLASFDREVMDQFLADEEKQAILTSEIVKIVEEKKLDGLNIDFEYLPDWKGENFAENFNQFLLKLKLELQKIDQKTILSVDIYPKAFVYNWPYDLAELGQIVDQVILMAYDFTQMNSARAGPVAPMRAQDEDEHSIIRTLQASFDKIERGKLFLGIPLYGYEWQTTDITPRSFTYPKSGVVASLGRVKKLIVQKNLKVNWDGNASSPWLVYQEGEAIKQIYFENLQSILLKVELAKQLKLGGIAFWALGYEGKRGEFWQNLRKKL